MISGSTHIGALLSSDNSWLRRAASVGFRKNQLMQKDRNGKPIDMMRLSVDAIGSRPTTHAVSDIRPHTAHLTAKRNASTTMADAMSSRPVTANIIGNKKSIEDYLHPSTKPENSDFEPALPDYVKTDKQVLRFYGYFLEDRVWDDNAPLGRSTIENKVCRNLTIYYYITDKTIEMIEEKLPNSGMRGGCFFRRDLLVGDTGVVVRATDFEVGGSVQALGRQIFIVDADGFTRNYFSHEYGIQLGAPCSRPQTLREDLGAQFATGLVATLSSPKEKHGICSQDYVDNKRSVMRSKQFLNFDGRVLRFTAVETSSLEPTLTDKGHPKFKKGKDKPKQYVLIYYLTDNTVETRLLRSSKTDVDDATTALKRCELPKNWRNAKDKFYEPQNYTPRDMVCGNIIDCFGRYFLLVSCDESSKKVSSDLGIEQKDIHIAPADIEVVKHAIPKLGDLFLPIGTEEDTLRNVFVAPKQKKNLEKQINNRGKILRARMKMVTQDLIQKSREFLVTLFLEDDTVQIFEEQSPNSGLVTGMFLKRGLYKNFLPPESDSPRYFMATDIFLGNVIETAGYKFQIYEIDALSSLYCEDKPAEFPLFDFYRIAQSVVHIVRCLPEDLRITLANRVDKKASGWLTKRSLLSALEQLGITESLNDQEIQTLLRRVAEDGQDKYYYHELCDLWSHLARISRSDSRSANTANNGLLGALGNSSSPGQPFMDSLRCRKVQWRRVIRKDPRTKNGLVTLQTLQAIFRRQGVNLSRPNIDQFRENYRSREDFDEVQISMDLDEPVLFAKASDKAVTLEKLTENMVRPDIRSSSRLMRTNAVGVSMGSWIGAAPPPQMQALVPKKEVSPKKASDIASTRKDLMKSIMRDGLKKNGEFDLSDIKPETNQEDSRSGANDMDEKFVVIDYELLCNDIYGEVAK